MQQEHLYEDPEEAMEAAAEVLEEHHSFQGWQLLH
jgi:hypothetical protein